MESILRRNRERLVQFLSNFHNDKEDEQFVDEKQYVLQIIECVQDGCFAVGVSEAWKKAHAADSLSFVW